MTSFDYSEFYAPFVSLKKQVETLFRLICCKKYIISAKKTS